MSDRLCKFPEHIAAARAFLEQHAGSLQNLGIPLPEHYYVLQTRDFHELLGRAMALDEATLRASAAHPDIFLHDLRACFAMLEKALPGPRN